MTEDRDRDDDESLDGEGFDDEVLDGDGFDDEVLDDDGFDDDDGVDDQGLGDESVDDDEGAAVEPIDIDAAARLAADLAWDRRGEDILLLDVESILVITSYFVIATGRNRKHLQGIADAITKGLRKKGLKRVSSEGYKEGHWVLLDFGDLIVQLFEPEARDAYDLESIWADAARVPWSPPPEPPAEDPAQASVEADLDAAPDDLAAPAPDPS